MGPTVQVRLSLVSEVPSLTVMIGVSVLAVVHPSSSDRARNQLLLVWSMLTPSGKSEAL